VIRNLLIHEQPPHVSLDRKDGKPRKWAGDRKTEKSWTRFRENFLGIFGAVMNGLSFGPSLGRLILDVRSISALFNRIYFKPWSVHPGLRQGKRPTNFINIYVLVTFKDI
jgi:hypothetical protein